MSSSSYLLGGLLVVYAASLWVRAGRTTPPPPPPPVAPAPVSLADPPPGIVRVVVDGMSRLVDVRQLGPDHRDEWTHAMHTVRRIANTQGTPE